MCVSIVCSNIVQQSLNRTNTNIDLNSNNDVNMVATMVTQLTNELARQEAAMTKYHEEVVTILEKQSKILSKLLKKEGKKSTSKSPSPSSTPMKDSIMNASTSTLPPTTSLGLSPDWSYSSSWADSYPICGEGGQSPVNLETVDVAVREHKAPLQFTSYDKINSDTCKLVNTGNTAILLLTTSLSKNPAMFGGPLNTTSYYFQQAVFHWGSDDNLGSDHTIRTISYPMEMQLIHGSTSEEQKLAVTSFLFEISPQDNPFLAPVISKLANIQVAGSEVPLNTTETANDITSVTTGDGNYQATDSFFMDQLMQESISGPYFSYKGSLTFPPCSMVEQWVVFRTPLDISIAQLEEFRKLLKKDGSRIGGNFRPVQPLGKRILAFTM